MIGRGPIISMVLAYALVAHPASAQTADEHASHHPGAGVGGAPASPAMTGGAPMAAPGATAAMAPNCTCRRRRRAAAGRWRDDGKRSMIRILPNA